MSRYSKYWQNNRRGELSDSLTFQTWLKILIFIPYSLILWILYKKIYLTIILNFNSFLYNSIFLYFVGFNFSDNVITLCYILWVKDQWLIIWILLSKKILIQLLKQITFTKLIFLALKELQHSEVYPFKSNKETSSLF